MPSFEIPDGPTTVALKTDAGFLKGTAVFGVTNKTGEGLTARFSVQIQGAGKAEWYAIDGEAERPVAAGETQTITINAKIPVATPPGQHRIKLRAINVNDPDNDTTESTAATVTVPAASAPAPKKPFPWWILAVVGGVLVVVIGVIIAIVALSGPKVPKVIGMDYGAAVTTLTKAGYKVAPEIDIPAADKPPGKVYLQDPVAGKKADPKTVEVKLTVAATALAAVPSVTGLDYATAATALEKAGFKAAPAINEVSKEKGLGLVFKQEPAGGEQADPKVEVKLTVAIGETVTVPSVEGKPYVAAQALLEDRGFIVAPRVVGTASGKDPDAVLVQQPAGETTAPKGSLVTLTVDPGVVVPDLLNPPVSGTVGGQTLQRAGLAVGTIISSCQGGVVDRILAQGVEPKTKVAKGTPVSITISATVVNARCFYTATPQFNAVVASSRTLAVPKTTLNKTVVLPK